MRSFARLGNGADIVNSFIDRHAVGIFDVRTGDVHLFHWAFIDIKHPCRVEVDDFDRALADIGPPQMRLLSSTHYRQDIGLTSVSRAIKSGLKEKKTNWIQTDVHVPG